MESNIAPMIDDALRSTLVRMNAPADNYDLKAAFTPTAIHSHLQAVGVVSRAPILLVHMGRKNKLFVCSVLDV